MPPWMIAAAAAAREAGDWRAACAAAGVDVALDLVRIRREYGRGPAEAVEEDLAHFAPDLLRWHLPRVPDALAIAPFTRIVLSPGRRDAPPLVLIPPSGLWGRQRLTLRASRRQALSGVSYFDAPRHLWDVRRADDLRAAWGGSADRPPLLYPDASPVPRDRLGARPDRAARTERILDLMDRALHVQAWRAAGIELDPTRATPTDRPLRRLEPYALWPVGVADEARRLAELYGVRTFNLGHPYPAIVVSVAEDGAVTARPSTRFATKGTPHIPTPVCQVPPDLMLLRDGGITPDALHPLVRASLFPRLGPPPVHPPSPPTTVADVPVPVRVRCRGVWHRVQVVNGRITALDHEAEEERREAVVRALGGTSAGCFAVLRTWTDGRGRLPRLLRYQRRDAFERIFHGDTAYVVAMLDAGRLDPRMRGWQGQTLLHMLVYLDHEVLLPRLLAAGLPVDVRDHHGRTPLYLAVVHDASADLVRALRRAGADLDAADQEGRTVRDRMRDKRPDRE